MSDNTALTVGTSFLLSKSKLIDSLVHMRLPSLLGIRTVVSVLQLPLSKAFLMLFFIVLMSLVYPL